MDKLKCVFGLACAVLFLSPGWACLPYQVNGERLYLSYDGRQCQDQACCRSMSKPAAAALPDEFLDGQAISKKLDQMIRERPFGRLPDSPFDTLIHEQAKRAGLDPLLVKSVIRVESNFNPYAVSKKGAGGLMQLMPETARRYGARNRFDPEQNIRAGTQLLSTLLSKWKKLELALAAYNAGESAVRRYGGVPPYKETQRFVKDVKGFYQRARTDQGASS